MVPKTKIEGIGGLQNPHRPKPPPQISIVLQISGEGDAQEEAIHLG